MAFGVKKKQTVVDWGYVKDFQAVLTVLLILLLKKGT